MVMDILFRLGGHTGKEPFLNRPVTNGVDTAAINDSFLDRDILGVWFSMGEP